SDLGSHCLKERCNRSAYISVAIALLSLMIRFAEKCSGASRVLDSHDSFTRPVPRHLNHEAKTDAPKVSRADCAYRRGASARGFNATNACRGGRDTEPH